MGRTRTESDLPPNIYLRGKGPNKKYYVRVFHKGKSRWRVGGTSIRAAQIVLGQLQKDIENERLGVRRRSPETLRSFAPTYLRWAEEHKRSHARDRRSLEKALIPELGDVRLADLNKKRVKEYMRTRRKSTSAKTGRTLSPGTVNREVACLRKLLSYAVEEEILEENPLLGVKLYAEPPGRQPALSHGDEKALLDACQPWLALAVRLAVLTGARQGELLALRWRHVDFDGRAIHILDSKSGESRRVPMHQGIADLLEPLRGLPSGPVVAIQPRRVYKKGTGVVTVFGSPAPHTVTQAFARACVRAVARAEKADQTPPALNGLRFHDLRHICGSRLLAAGASLPEVQTMLGHKTLHMARRYAHTNWNRLSNLVDRMPLLGNADES